MTDRARLEEWLRRADDILKGEPIHNTTIPPMKGES